MPKISLEVRKEKVRRFASEYIPKLNDEFASLTIENKENDSTPRVRISFGDMLCLVMYEADQEVYSLNWYSSDRRISDEITSNSMSDIGDKMMDDARIHFRRALKNADMSRDHTNTHTPPNNLMRVISFVGSLAERNSEITRMLTEHIHIINQELPIAILTYPNWDYRCSVAFHAGRYICIWSKNDTRVKTTEFEDEYELVTAVLGKSDEFGLLHAR